MEWALSVPGEVHSVRDLRDKFYLYHTDVIRGRRCGLNPNALILNPIQLINVFNEMVTPDTYYVVYCRGYFVTVEHNERSMLTGHKACLFIQVYPPNVSRYAKNELLGIGYIDCNFFNEKGIYSNLRRLIRQRKYVIGTKIADMMIDFTLPEDKDMII